MTTLSYETDVKASVEKVYNYCTDPDNIKDTWPADMITDSTNISGTKGEKGSMFKVKGHYSGKEDKEEEMRMMVTERWPNSRYMTKQIDGPFKKWESVQEFEVRDNNTTHIRHTINYELPRAGKIIRRVSRSDADDKIRIGMEEYIQTLKYKMESGR
jgi:ligand-binding SRPBCC domain-containing protein